MGNCQATEVATVVLQHPGGRLERMYWPASAAEVMRSYPGHYVALITTTTTTTTTVGSQDYSQQEHRKNDGGEMGRITRVRLLRPKDTLVLGQVYRLVSSQDVVKGLRARKQERMKKHVDFLKTVVQQQQQQQQDEEQADQKEKVDTEKTAQAARTDRKAAQPAAARPRQWRPSLQSISEAAG